jgi:branched-subunit amino acid aminotransferase/4-amino-4-deoxychorismate lyase
MPPAFVQANTNGRLHSAAEPSVSPLNRGFLYGDAIYEVWRTYHGVVFAWEEHWRRLEQSAAALHLPLPWSQAEIWREVARTAAAYRAETNDEGELYIRLQISRGGGAIGLDIALADRAEYVILVQPCPVNSAETMLQGLRLTVATTLRRNPTESLNPAWKTGNYLNNILCLREARARGADDVLMLNLRGEITEAATSNVAWVRGGEVLTPPLAAGILGGITRALLLAPIAVEAGLTTRECPLRIADLAQAEECFLLSTTKGISAVGSVDDTRFQVGADTATARLQAAYAAYVQRSAASHPALRV